MDQILTHDTSSDPSPLEELYQTMNFGCTFALKARLKTLFLSVVLLLIAGRISSGLALFRKPESAPVNRLIENLTSRLEQHPEDAGLHYMLARVHYLAFYLKQSEVPADGPDWRVDSELHDINSSSAYSQKELMEHAITAKHEFTRSLQLAPRDGLAQLGLACLLNEIQKWNAGAHSPIPLPSELSSITLSQVLDAYVKAWELNQQRVEEFKETPAEGLESIAAYECVDAIVRLGKTKDAHWAESEKKEIEKARQLAGRFENLPPPSVITPIVFSFERSRRLAELLSPQTTVDFDLRGYGFHEQWPWVKPTTGFLVWDPLKTGQITSARQMFGGYTFQIFWRDGYEALSALDDNGDGVLSGPELDGISVWFDRNSDGKCTPDEMIPVRELGVEFIAVHPDGMDGRHPTHSRGIILKDGREIRTWDWMVEPVETPK